KLWIETHGDIDIILPAIPTALLRKLSYICETINIESTGNWQVFNWQKTLAALLKLPHRMTRISAGEVTIKISDLDKTLKLWANDTDAGCKKTSGKPDISITSYEAMAILFGPASPDVIADIPSSAQILKNWCPLPLHLPI